MISYLLEAFYEKYAQAVFENADERLEDLIQLAFFAQQYDSLNDFLADATLSEGFKSERAAIKGSSASVTDDYLILSTIHQAKGLEWDNVFVIGLVDGQFPHYKSLKSRAELEEERRLFYVAVTRAKKRLFLTYPLSQYGSFGAAIHRPSLFVREIDPILYRTTADFEDEEQIIEID